MLAAQKRNICPVLGKHTVLSGQLKGLAFDHWKLFPYSLASCLALYLVDVSALSLSAHQQPLA